MEQSTLKLIADSMSAFALYLSNPKEFNWDWFKNTHHLNDKELQILKDHMRSLTL